MADWITFPVDSDVAAIYRAVSEKERGKLDLLVNLWLREAVAPGQSLGAIMGEISRSAQQRGLTPDILESILNEE